MCYVCSYYFPRCHVIFMFKTFKFFEVTIIYVRRFPWIWVFEYCVWLNMYMCYERGYIYIYTNIFFLVFGEVERAENALWDLLYASCLDVDANDSFSWKNINMGCYNCIIVTFWLNVSNALSMSELNLSANDFNCSMRSLCIIYLYISIVNL